MVGDGMGVNALGLAAWLLASGSIAADSWVCTQGGLIREVTVYYPKAPALLPCHVYYTKRTENGLPRALWTAAHEEGFCQRRATIFVDNLGSLGWQCTVNGEPTARIAPAR